jgi:hypothetical protein
MKCLRSALGDELFTKCLKEFIARWNGKHPTPWDMFYTFEDVAKTGFKLVLESMVF